MNTSDAWKLLGIIRAICPSQRIDKVTGEAWSVVLDDVALDDALAAVRAIARSGSDKPLYIDPRQIINQIRHDRAGRINGNEHLLVGAPTDPDAYVAWLKTSRDGVANGQPSPIEPPRHTDADTIREIRRRAQTRNPRQAREVRP